MSGYATETLDPDEDDGTMPENVEKVRAAVVGRKIVKAQKEKEVEFGPRWYRRQGGFVITLDDGTRVLLADGGDCCAYTELESFFLNAANIDHAITGVGTTGGYTKWHIHADLGDVLTIDVAWSPGNAFYYGYGFDIAVIHPDEEESN